MTSLEDIDARRRLTAQRTTLALMLGVTCAGFWDEMAFYVIALHAVIWLCLLLAKSAVVRELELADDPNLHKPPREVISMKKG